MTNKNIPRHNTDIPIAEGTQKLPGNINTVHEEHKLFSPSAPPVPIKAPPPGNDED